MKSNENQSEDARMIEFMVGMPLGAKMRVAKKTAARWLMENKSVNKGGTVYFLQIFDLGLGVCEIALRPVHKRGTFVVKRFEID